MTHPKKTQALDKQSTVRTITAYENFCRDGRSNVSCDQCHSEIRFEWIAANTISSSCKCGKYNDIGRGL
jgi:hypothetical protein